MTADELTEMKADVECGSMHYPNTDPAFVRKLAGHCRRLLVEREQYDTLASDTEAETDELHNRASALTAENRQLKAEAMRVTEERDKLQAFKSYVHKRLDEAGVTVDPESSHRDRGCRIGGRLDEVFAVIVALSADVKRLEKESGFGSRIMDAIKRYREGDKDALAGMRVDWVDDLLAEIARLKRGDFTPEEFQNLCHHRDEKPGCTPLDFMRGCVDYTRKLFGAPPAPAVDVLAHTNPPVVFLNGAPNGSV